MTHTLRLTPSEYTRIVDDLNRTGEAVYGIGGVLYSFGYNTGADTTVGYVAKRGEFKFGLTCNERNILGTHGVGGPVTLTVEVG